MYLIHHGIDGQKWGVRNGPPYPLDANDLSAAERKADTGEIKRASGVKEAVKNSKTMSNDELRKSAERLELESRYVRAVQNQQGKSFVERAANKLNTVSNLLNSTSSIIQSVTGKNLAQLIQKPDGNDVMKKKIADLELENKYYNEVRKKNKRMKDPGEYIDWDTIFDDWLSE